MVISEYIFLYINHSWLKLTACFLFLAIVFTQQCWYCSQKFHSYALSFIHTTSSHNYTKLHMCIWWWCVANDCPWLSNSTLLVILILLHSMYDWICTGALLMWMHKCFVHVMWQYDTITLFNFKYHEDKHVVCVCVKNWAKFCSEYLKEQGLLGRTRSNWQCNIKMDL